MAVILEQINLTISELIDTRHDLASFVLPNDFNIIMVMVSINSNTTVTYNLLSHEFSVQLGGLQLCKCLSNCVLNNGIKRDTSYKCKV